MATPVDRLLVALDPTNVNQLIQASLRRADPDPKALDSVRATLDRLYTDVAISPLPLLASMLDSTREQRTKMAQQLKGISVAPPELAASAQSARQRQRIAELEGQLKALSEEARATKEHLEGEIAGLQAQVDILGVDGDGDESDDDGDDDQPRRYLSSPGVVYITRLAWALVIRYVDVWRKSRGADGASSEFVDWLIDRALLEPGALSAVKVLQRATDFNADWIDPMQAFGKETPAETVELLRVAAADARGREVYDVSEVLREPTMTHVVFSHEAWPAVIASLRAFNVDHWHADPIDYLIWLNDDDKRRQLLALLSWGDPLDRETLLRDLPEVSQRYFDLVVQEAANQREANQFPFVPVPIEYVRAQLKDALSLIDRELPRLQAELKPEELQDARVYRETLDRIRKLRKQLPLDWLGRLSATGMRSLVDDSMVNDTDANRDAVVAAFESILETMAAESSAGRLPIKWVI